MKHVKKSVLLWYSPQEMFDLVVAVSEYPAFLPWCERGELLQAHEGGVTARLHLRYAGVRQAFTTRNTHEAGRRVTLSLVDGPFSLLEGCWHFVPLAGSDDSGSEPKACKIEFELRYAFANRALEAVVSPVFDRVANTLVESFVKRAEQIYGAR
jgi:ribosome-associated toxin RatA of RatAB toxin-antitoxin module